MHLTPLPFRSSLISPPFNVHPLLFKIQNNRDYSHLVFHDYSFSFTDNLNITAIIWNLFFLFIFRCFSFFSIFAFLFAHFPFLFITHIQCLRNIFPNSQTTWTRWFLLSLMLIVKLAELLLASIPSWILSSIMPSKNCMMVIEITLEKSYVLALFPNLSFSHIIFWSSIYFCFSRSFVAIALFRSKLLSLLHKLSVLCFIYYLSSSIHIIHPSWCFNLYLWSIPPCFVHSSLLLSQHKINNHSF